MGTPEGARQAASIRYGKATRGELELRETMRERLARPQPMAIERANFVTDACMCGGTIRVDGEPFDEAIRDAVRYHNASERHQTYMSGAKYLP